MANLGEMEEQRKRELEFKTKSQAMRDEVENNVKAILAVLSPLEKMVYEFVFKTAFVNDSLKKKFLEYFDEVLMGHRNEGDIDKWGSHLSGWVRGQLDYVKGNHDVVENKLASKFIREVIDLADDEAIISTHLRVLSFYINTQDKLEKLKLEYFESPKEKKELIFGTKA